MDYAGLTVTIGGALNRGDLFPMVPGFIALCEAEVGRTLRHWRMIARAEAQIAVEFEALPSDFLELISVTLDGTDEVLDGLSIDALAYRKATESLITGKPDSYALVGSSLQSFPAPDQAYGTIISYFQAIPALSGSNTSNWLLANYPDVYLYGTLSHASAFLAPDPRIATWRGLYDAAVVAVSADGVKAMFGARLTPRASNVI